jgi:hypothetical protein
MAMVTEEKKTENRLKLTNNIFFSLATSMWNKLGGSAFAFSGPIWSGTHQFCGNRYQKNTISSTISSTSLLKGGTIIDINRITIPGQDLSQVIE